MGREKWSKAKIIENLIELYYEGKCLNRKDIPNNLYAVIHRKNKETKEGEYFNSIFEAREAAALELERTDAFEDAEKVRQYNHVVHSGNTLTEEDIKKNLIKILKRKIEQKEDVSYITQKNKNSVFVHRCKKRFGSYEALFTEAGLDYYKFVKQDMRPKEVFLDQLINDFILKNKDLDRISVEEEDPDLVKHLKARYGRYYHGLQAALDRAFEKELIEESEKTDIDFWRQKRSKEHNAKMKKQAKIKQKTRKNILVINRDKLYDSFDIDFIQIDESSSGEKIHKKLKQSLDWFTVQNLSILYEVSYASMNYFLTTQCVENGIKYQRNHNLQIYYFSKKVFKKIEKNKFKNCANNSLKDLIKSLSILDNKLNNVKPNNKNLDKDQKNILRFLFDKRINFFNKINEKISPYVFYDCSFQELNKDLTKDIPDEIKHFEIDGLKCVRGDHILNCLKKGINNTHYLNLQNFNIFYQNLFSVTNLTTEYELSNVAVQNRLEKILQKNPSSFFRFQKDGKTFRVVTSDLLPYFENTDLTPDIDLSAVLEKMNNFDESFVDEKIKDLESILDKKTSYKDNESLFEKLEHLRFCNAGNTRISIYDLVAIKDLMIDQNYASLDVGKVFSFEEIKSLIPDEKMKNRINYIVNKTQWKIYYNNEKLISTILKKIGIFDDKLFKIGGKHSTLLDAGKDGLLTAIKRYDITKNAQFSTFAFDYIRGYILKFLTYKQLKTTSLSKQFGDETELIEFIEDENIKSPENIILDQSLKQNITKTINSALDELTERERDILNLRYGLNGERENTLKEIGEKHNLTRARIGQIEKKALEKLRNKEIIKGLGLPYGLE